MFCQATDSRQGSPHSLLESDCTTHPLLSNERIRLYIFAAIPCWGYPFLSLFLSPPPPPRQGTLLHLWVSVVSLRLECILDCWHMQGASIHVHKTPLQSLNTNKHPYTWAQKLMCTHTQGWEFFFLILQADYSLLYLLILYMIACVCVCDGVFFRRILGWSKPYPHFI